MIELLVLLAISIISFLLFIIRDAQAAFDGNPYTPSFSAVVRPLRALVWAIIVAAFAGATYLLLHLGLGSF